MPDSAIERAYRESGALLLTLGLRLLGSVEEGEGLVRRVFAAAARGDAPLDRRTLVQAGAARVADARAADARRRLGTVQGTIEAHAEAREVAAEADRLLLRAEVEALEPARREVLERVLIHGDPVPELALMTGVDPAAVAAELRSALLSLWHARALEAPHAPPDLLARVVLGESVDDDRAAHLRMCGVCRAARDSLAQLMVGVRRLPMAGPLARPREELWPDVVEAIESGEGIEKSDPQRDARERRSRSRRRALATSAGVVVLVLIGLSVVVVQRLLEPGDGDVLARAVLVDPRTEAQVGDAVLVGEAGERILRVSGPFAESSGLYYELWLVSDLAGRVSLGPMLGVHDETTLPVEPVDGEVLEVRVTREPWDGDPEPSDDVVAHGVLH